MSDKEIREERIKKTKNKRPAKVEVVLPARCKDMGISNIKKEIGKLDTKVAKLMESVSPINAEIAILKQHLINEDADCKHEELVRVGGRYKCKNPDCGKKIRI